MKEEDKNTLSSSETRSDKEHCSDFHFLFFFFFLLVLPQVLSSLCWLCKIFVDTERAFRTLTRTYRTNHRMVVRLLVRHRE